MNTSIEHTEINDLLRRTTVKINSPVEVGSGALYKPSANSHIVYVLTARHVLMGENGSPEDVLPHQITLTFLFNPQSYTHLEYQLQASDLILVSDNPHEDFAALVVPIEAIEQFTGTLPCLTLIRETHGLKKCLFRGFPDAYLTEEPIRMEGTITEESKNLPNQFEWEVPQSLDDHWISNASRTAYENVRGFSGSGFFLVNDEEVYLLGIVSKFGAFNRFLGEKISFLESLIHDKEQLLPLVFCEPEVRPEVKTCIKKLDANSKTEVLDRVKDTIGGKPGLPRAQLINDLTKAIETNPVVIVHGEAGAGKSAAVKNCLVDGKQRFFAIKGEQICEESLHTTLKSITGTDVDLKTLLTSPLLKEPVVIWVDGAEKSIERNQTAALIDLIRLTAECSSLRIVITIRKYALEHFRLLILNATSHAHVYEVPLLSPEEQELIGQQFPAVRSFLDNPKLRRLLRVPFYLNYAVMLNEPIEAGKELDEFTFREKIWLLAIAGGTRNLPRAAVFTDLAVKRATEMALYVRVDKADFDIVEELEREHILVRENETADRFAPAHDIFEDWALVRHVRYIFQDHRLPADLFQHLGSAYAIRRGFRFWLQEEVQHDPNEVLRFAARCIADSTIDQYWKDETFTVLLHSDEGTRFLHENQTLLLSNNARLLLRFIHLFRVASKEPDASALESKEAWKLYSSTFIPVGNGWATLIHFLYQHLDEVKHNNTFYLFLKDWSCKLEWNKPLPSEAREAGLLLLTVFQRMRKSHIEGLLHPENETREEVLRLIFRLTEVLVLEVKTILEETLNAIKVAKDKNHRLDSDYELIWAQMLFLFHSKELCRYFPDLIMEGANLRWIKNKESKHQSRHDVNRDFGLKNEFKLNDYPASAWQTPTLWLLRLHHKKALDWIIYLMNYCTQKYLESEFSKTYKDEDILEIELKLNDGTKIKQLGNSTLYQMFRGTRRVTPYLLQSILMALEKWLFELAECKQETSRKLLRLSFRNLLEESKTVATTSVLVSVAIAHSEEVGEEIYPLLTNLAIYDWDMDRQYQEQSALNPIGGAEYGLDYSKERREAKQMPHRKIRLEEYVINRSFKDLEFRSKFHEILDQFWVDTSPEPSTWRIFLNRMDIRKWEIINVEESDGKYITEVQPKLEEDLRPMVEEARQQQAESDSISAASVWAQKVFDHEVGYHFTYEDWLRHYDLIRSIEHLTLGGLARITFSPALLAAVAIRDGLSDLNAEQLAWCENTLFARAKSEVDAARRMYPDLSMAKSPFEDVPCLLSLVLLLRKQHNSKLHPDVIVLLFEALLFIELSDNLKNKLFDYVRDNLWTVAPDIAYTYWVGLINYASLWREYPRYSYDAPLFPASKKEAKKFEQEKAKLIQSVLDQTIVLQKLPDVLDKRSHWWYDKALKILPVHTQNDECRKFVGNYLNLLLKTHVHDESDWDSPIEFDTSRQFFAEYFAKFIFAQSKDVALPLFDQLLHTILQAKPDDQSIFKFVQRSVEEIIKAMAQNNNLSTQIFGYYWKRLLNASIAANNKYFSAKLLLESPYLYDHVTDWQPIRDNKALFIEIVQKMGEHVPNSVVRLLAGIGSDILLPDGLILLHEILQKRGLEQIKIHDMERLLNRVWVFHAPGIRKNRDLLQRLMAILDLMVEKGSSLAFFMRESLFGG